MIDVKREIKNVKRKKMGIVEREESLFSCLGTSDGMRVWVFGVMS